MIKLQPFVSAGEVFLHDDGVSFEVVSLSLFQLDDGFTIFRIGRNTYVFNSDGSYDGPECMPDPDGVDLGVIVRALETCSQNRNRRPEKAYFNEGSPGWKAETAIWPVE